MVVVNCETDFVAQNADFSVFANTILDLAIANNATSVDAVKALSYAGNGLTVGDKIIEQTGVIGEKIEISAFEVIEAVRVVSYNHPGNQIASIVGLTADEEDAGRQVAMQIAAMAPIAVDERSVPADVIAKELEIAKDLAIQEGKPAEMAEKIAQGRLNKFFYETTLLHQTFVRDGKKSVKEFLKETNPNLTVTDFKRVSLSI